MLDPHWLYESVLSQVEAVQWKGHNRQDLADFLEGAGRLVWHDCMLLAGRYGAQGWVTVPVGHWIVRQPGDHSDYWPVDPAYFAAKYQKAWLRL